jgi:hypothetical protein
MSYSDEQRQLAAELRNLTARARARNAFVFDAWGLIWCSASLTFGDDQACLHAQVGAILDEIDPPLTRGGKVDRIFTHELSMYCVSFAATYVLGVWLADETSEFTLRRSVKAALPMIESMTLALPPPDGTDTTSGAGRSRA